MATPAEASAIVRGAQQATADEGQQKSQSHAANIAIFRLKHGRDLEESTLFDLRCSRTVPGIGADKGVITTVSTMTDGDVNANNPTAVGLLKEVLMAGAAQNAKAVVTAAQTYTGDKTSVPAASMQVIKTLSGHLKDSTGAPVLNVKFDRTYGNGARGLFTLNPNATPTKGAVFRALNPAPDVITCVASVHSEKSGEQVCTRDAAVINAAHGKAVCGVFIHLDPHAHRIADKTSAPPDVVGTFFGGHHHAGENPLGEVSEDRRVVGVIAAEARRKRAAERDEDRRRKRQANRGSAANAPVVVID